MTGYRTLIFLLYFMISVWAGKTLCTNGFDCNHNAQERPRCKAFALDIDIPHALFINYQDRCCSISPSLSPGPWPSLPLPLVRPLQKTFEQPGETPVIAGYGWLVQWAWGHSVALEVGILLINPGQGQLRTASQVLKDELLELCGHITIHTQY